jgi:ATP-dependent helicase HrpA
VVETSNVFAREVAAIDPEWVTGINPALLKHHCYEPRWQQRSGRVMAYERITLYGLTVADKQSVHYGPLAPAEARELLIREGLVAGKYRQHPGFLKHNLRLVRELEELESRTRRRDILVDEHALFEFYDERLPADAYTAGRLQGWLKRQPGADASLRMQRDTVLARDPGAELGDQFPDHLVFEDMRFRLSYQFEPGKSADGVSVTVPVALLNRVPRFLFDWLVPGLLKEKCVQLVKSLPKDKRRHLVPAPDFVDKALAQIQPGNVDMLSVLAKILGKLGGIPLGPDDWGLDKLDDYYRMNIRVVDADGKLLEQGRGLATLIERFRSDTRQSINADPDDSPARSGISRWDFGDLAREWRFRQAGVEIVSYPALVDKGDTAAIELCDYPGEARLRHRLGVLRLLRLHSAQQVKYLRKQSLRGNQFNLLLAGAGLDRDTLIDDLIDASYMQAMTLGQHQPYSQAEFEALLAAGKGDVIGCASELDSVLLNTLTVLVEIRRLLLQAGKYPDTAKDIQQQLQALLAPGFQRDTPGEWLAQYPRYMKATRHRLERLSGQYAKDQAHSATLQSLAAPLAAARQQRPGLLLLCSAACQYRWMLEELRVSLFAQNLGTRQAVSAKRLQEQWQVVQQWLTEHPH